MIRKISGCFLISMALLFSGCFGLEEKVYLKADGSGTFTYSMDMTTMVEKLMEFEEAFEKALGDNDSTETSTEETDEPESDLREETFKEAKEDFMFNKLQIEKVKGISSFREFVDTTGGRFVFGCSFDFANVSNLNKALAVLLEKNEKSDELSLPVYAFKNGVFSRAMKEEQVKKLVGDSEMDEKGKELLEGFYYRVVYEFENEITEVTAPGAEVNQQGKTVTINYDLLNASQEVISSNMKSQVKLK